MMLGVRLVSKHCS